MKIRSSCDILLSLEVVSLSISTSDRSCAGVEPGVKPGVAAEEGRSNCILLDLGVDGTELGVGGCEGGRDGGCKGTFGRDLLLSFSVVTGIGVVALSVTSTSTPRGSPLSGFSF